MVAMANLEIPSQFLRRYIASAINVIIHQARLADGRRKLISVQEITGMEGDIITLQEIFSFQQKGLDENGKVKGVFRFHGIRPKFIDRFKAFGIDLPVDIFDPTRIKEV